MDQWKRDAIRTIRSLERASSSWDYDEYGNFRLTPNRCPICGQEEHFSNCWIKLLLKLPDELQESLDKLYDTFGDKEFTVVAARNCLEVTTGVAMGIIGDLSVYGKVEEAARDKWRISNG